MSDLPSSGSKYEVFTTLNLKNKINTQDFKDMKTELILVLTYIQACFRRIALNVKETLCNVNLHFLTSITGSESRSTQLTASNLASKTVCVYA
jgi:hypothetical protein